MSPWKIIAKLGVGLVVVLAAGFFGASPASADEVACAQAEASVNDIDVNTGLQCVVLPL